MNRQKRKYNAIKKVNSSLQNDNEDSITNLNADSDNSEGVTGVKNITKPFWNEYKQKIMEPLTLATIILALATIILTIFTYKLYNEASTQGKVSERADSTAIATLEETKRQFDVRNRAIVQIVTVSWDSTYNPGFRVDYQIMNEGTSPGIIDSLHPQLDILFDDFKVHAWPPVYVTNHFIQPSPVILNEWVTLTQNITYKDDFKTGKVKAIFFGTAKYHTYGENKYYLLTFSYSLQYAHGRLDVEPISNEEKSLPVD